MELKRRSRRLLKKGPEAGVERVLLSEARIRRRVRELGRRITRDYRGRDLLVIGILKGSVIFLADLLRSIRLPCAVDFLAVSSYNGDRSSGAVRVTMDLREAPARRDVLLVEDVVDTGLTLDYLKRSLLLARHARSFKVCALLDKPACRRVPAAVDYVGFTVPDKFVVGYGLDHNERFRNLPYIGILRREPADSPAQRRDK